MTSYFRFFSDNKEIIFSDKKSFFFKSNLFFIPIYGVLKKDHVIQLFKSDTILQC